MTPLHGIARGAYESFVELDRRTRGPTAWAEAGRQGRRADRDRRIEGRDRSCLSDHRQTVGHDVQRRQDHPRRCRAAPARHGDDPEAAATRGRPAVRSERCARPARRTRQSSGTGAISTRSDTTRNGRRRRCRSPGATRSACRRCRTICILSIRSGFMQHCPIAIVGGGLAGLGAAIALERFGFAAAGIRGGAGLGRDRRRRQYEPQRHEGAAGHWPRREDRRGRQCQPRHLHPQYEYRRAGRARRPGEVADCAGARRTTRSTAPTC